MRKRYKIIFIFTPLLIFFLSLYIGRYPISIMDIISSFKRFLGLNSQITDQAYTVIIKFRLPRALAASFVGASLCTSGTAYQGIFQNPLVSPGILGVSAGAGFGAALCVVFFGNGIYTCIFAFVFGFLAVILSYMISGIYKSSPAIMMVLGGTIVSSVFNALISLIKFLADTQKDLPAIVYWLMGSLSSVSLNDLWAIIPMSAGIIILVMSAWKINVLSMGEKEAAALGVAVKKSKTMIILACTLATASAVCICGIVGWVGLVIPHISRSIIGNDNRKLMLVNISLGSGFMMIVDVISRSVSSSELPLGVITSLLGAPFFVYILKKTKGGGWQF